jgi:hypothetical protein
VGHNTGLQQQSCSRVFQARICVMLLHSIRCIRRPKGPSPGSFSWQPCSFGVQHLAAPLSHSPPCCNKAHRVLTFPILQAAQDRLQPWGGRRCRGGRLVWPQHAIARVHASVHVRAAADRRAQRFRACITRSWFCTPQLCHQQAPPPHACYHEHTHRPCSLPPAAAGRLLCWRPRPSAVLLPPTPLWIVLHD